MGQGRGRGVGRGRPGRARAALPTAARRGGTGAGAVPLAAGGARAPVPPERFASGRPLASGGRAAGVRRRGRNRPAAGAQPGAGRPCPYTGGPVPPLRGEGGARSRLLP